MATSVSQGRRDEVGIEPVQRSRQVLGTWDMFVLWADLGISFLAMVVGMFLVPGLGLGEALLAILGGAVIGNLLLGLAAGIGFDTGMPTMALSRRPLGERGSYVPTVLNISQLLGWAVFEVLLARAPRDAQAILSGGLVGLDAELSWFEAHAARRRLALDARRQATTATYLALLEGLQAAPNPAAIVGLWTIERAYLDAWQGALPCAPTYREFVEHWTTAVFGDYVAGLGRAADLSLLGAGAEIWSRARARFLDVARIEGEFWQMAWPEPAP